MLVFTREQVRRVDAEAIETIGIPGIVLMENASRRLADAATDMIADVDSPHVLIVCGGGNNGGDGLALARHLHNRRARVTIVLTRPPEKYGGDAGTNLAICRAMNLHVIEAADDPVAGLRGVEPTPHLVVDGLLGTGIDSEVRGSAVDVIGWINDQPAPVLAIDIPSGLDCDRGEPLGCAVVADRTVTFVGMKAGFLADGAGRYTGEVEVADIGAPRELAEKHGERRGQ